MAFGGIKGLKAQKMGGAAVERRARHWSFNAPDQANTPQVWTCPETGRYSVYLWGVGGEGHYSSGATPGQSGALAVAENIRIEAGDKVTFNIPRIRETNAANKTATAVFSNGRPSMTCTAADNADVGSTRAFASGGTVNFNGLTAAEATARGYGAGPDGGSLSTIGGAPGPGYNGFKGGNSTNSYFGGVPGAGGRAGSERSGGEGLAIVVKED